LAACARLYSVKARTGDVDWACAKLGRPAMVAASAADALVPRSLRREIDMMTSEVVGKKGGLFH
jgi:hypothetical protein